MYRHSERENAVQTPIQESTVKTATRKDAAESELLKNHSKMSSVCSGFYEKTVRNTFLSPR